MGYRLIVTQEDIDNANNRRHDPNQIFFYNSHCPIAMALRRDLAQGGRYPSISVYGSYARVEHRKIYFPPQVSNRISEWDEFETMEPFEIDLWGEEDD